MRQAGRVGCEIGCEIDFEGIRYGNPDAELDLVVPFTTPELTRCAVAEAGRLGSGLNARIRLLKIQLVPYPLELDDPPVVRSFLVEQLRGFHAELPLAVEVVYARDFEPALLAALGAGSVVVLATKKRPWRTRPEAIARRVRAAGHQVAVLQYAGNGNEKNA